MHWLPPHDGGGGLFLALPLQCIHPIVRCYDTLAGAVSRLTKALIASAICSSVEATHFRNVAASSRRQRPSRVFNPSAA
jgi:hypothetical protein